MADATTAASEVLGHIRGGMAAVHQSVGREKRGQHPKGHGVVHATFEVLSVPAQLAVGLFAKPGLYSGWIRFSNGKDFDDQARDAHGMAIKVCGVPGKKLLEDELQAETQDFVLADSPAFFAKDAGDFLRFMGTKKKQSEELLTAKAAGKSPAELKELGAAQGAAMVQAFPALLTFLRELRVSPLEASYHSQVPYQLGTQAVKYEVRPIELVPLKDPAPVGPEFLRARMAQQLIAENRSASFVFGVRVATNDTEAPLEDATKEWPDNFVPLAKITIPPQNFLAETQVAFGEQLSFSPWHSLEAHQPLGSINLARKEVYRDSSIARHQITRTPRLEPSVQQVSHPNVLVLRRFFGSFAVGDYRGMQACLHPDVHFEDLGFNLDGKKVGAMWHMLCIKQPAIRVAARSFVADATTGSALWECDYEFKKDESSKDGEGRPIHNEIKSAFTFKDGLILSHVDTCDFWVWFEQAMGSISKGAKFFDVIEDNFVSILGVEDKLRKKVKASAQEKITKFISHFPEYQ